VDSIVVATMGLHYQHPLVKVQVRDLEIVLIAVFLDELHDRTKAVTLIVSLIYHPGVAGAERGVGGASSPNGLMRLFGGSLLQSFCSR